MVVTVPTVAGVRYRLLETSRQFAADRLVEQSDANGVLNRHATYWCDRAVGLGRAFGGTDQRALDASAGDLTAAGHRGEAMTIEELTDCALDALT